MTGGRRLRMVELCAGYGGLHLAAVQAGLPVDLAWYAEIDPDASKVLAAHHPRVLNVGDISVYDWSTATETVDLLAAGYPCQSFSNAGLRKGFDDERAVWPHVAAAIRHLRPRSIFLENVSGHLARGFGRVLADLAHLGYVGSWRCVRASDLGAPHRRERVFILAHPAGAATDPDSVAVWRQLVGLGTRHRPAVAGRDRPNALMPTPGHRLGEGRGQPGEDTARARFASGRRNLDDAVTLLPTPAARDAGRGAGWGDQPGRPLSETVLRLLPTPTVADSRGSRNATAERSDGSSGSGGWTLTDTVHAGLLLPTPRATDGTKDGPNQRGSAGDLMLPSAVQPGRWGQYASAVARWEPVVGRAAPDPTVTGPRGGQRLSPLFVEWMMGLPAGWVTDLLDRNAALRVLGNGVVPAQGAQALRSLAVAAWAAGTRQ